MKGLSKCIYIGGVKGVGKSSLLKAALKGLKREIPIGKGSVIMKELASLESVEELCLLDPEKRAILRDKSQDIMFNSKKDFVLDGHYSIPAKNGNYEFPFDKRHWQKIAAFAIITSTPDEVYARRASDVNIKPRELSQDAILADLQIEIKTAKELAKKYCKPLHIIENDSNFEKAALELQKIIEKVLD